MKNYKYIILLLLILIIPNVAIAANHYVRAGATGNGSGSDWVNAYSSLPSSLIRGDTYYVADGNYPSYSFDDAIAGSAYIFIKKATIADHGTNTGWNITYGDGTATFSAQLNFLTGYYDINGQTRNSDWESGYGFKFDSSSNHLKCINITTSGISNINIRYVEMAGGGIDGASYRNDLVYLVASSSNLLIQNCYLHDSGRCPFLSRNFSNVTIERCYIARNDDSYEQHAEGISAATSNNWILRYNIWEDIKGTGCIMIGDSSGWEIYGNLIFWTESFDPSYIGWSNGCIATWTGMTVSNTVVYNNTIVDIDRRNCGISFGSNNNNRVYNNLWCTASATIGFSGVTHDYNAFPDSNGRGEAHPQTNIEQTIFVNHAADNFRLSRDSIGGVALQSPYDYDFDGNRRGSDGIWDRGAFEHGGSGVSELPSPPKNLMVFSQE